MQLEFHQLDRRWEHLRVRHAARQRRLLASLAEAGQQTPIVVVAAEDQADRYVVIDGYKRIVALEQLGRDTVEAVVWPMSEAAAVLLDRSLRLSEHETALEVGWLLAELERRFDYGLEELARRFDRSVSWVSRRLALAEVLPEAIQQQVREGKIPAQVAMKFLVPVARQRLEDCQRMAAIVNRAQRRLAGAAAIEVDGQQCEAVKHQIEHIQRQLGRIGEGVQPRHVESITTSNDCGTGGAGSEQTRDRAGVGDLPRGGAQSAALAIHAGAGVAPAGESRTLPAADPGAFGHLQGESRASP